ncbi:MAG: DUF2934 domain-containing protein [Pseudomonadota bacterium]
MPVSKTASATKKASTSKAAVAAKAPAKKAAAPKKTAAPAAAKVTASKSTAAPKKSASAKKGNGHTTVSPEQRYRMICDAAYFRAERRGFVGGNPAQDWLEAEAEIDLMLKKAGK